MCLTIHVSERSQKPSKRNPKNKNRKNRFVDYLVYLSTLLFILCHSLRQRPKATEAGHSNKDASTSGQGHAHPKTAISVCISRNNRSYRDCLLCISRNGQTMRLNPRSCQRGFLSWCVFTLLTLIASLTVSKMQVTLLFGSGVSSTCLYGCCARARSTKMGHIDPCTHVWVYESGQKTSFLEFLSSQSVYTSSDTRIDSAITFLTAGYLMVKLFHQEPTRYPTLENVESF